MCGNKKCEERLELRSWEVNFAYVEHGEKKNALIKLSKLLTFIEHLKSLMNPTHFIFTFSKDCVQNVRKN